jgi:predicted dienelactone hydrolase
VKLILKTLGVLALLVMALFAFLTFSHQPDDFPDASASAKRLVAGPWAVAEFSETFVDRERPTQPNGDYPGDTQRTLKGDVWYALDAEAGAQPLVVLSHGFTSSRHNSTYLAEHLASYGFVVVAVDYPLTSMSAPGGALVQDVVNQPGDVSFLIDTLLGYSAVSGHALSGRIDSERIGVAGISLGGLTSTLLGFHPDLRDSRVGAVLSIAGPSNLFTRQFFTHAQLPFLLLAGDLDALLPYSDHAAPIPLPVGDVAGSESFTGDSKSHMLNRPPSGEYDALDVSAYSIPVI